jgi:hypothetical protein
MALHGADTRMPLDAWVDIIHATLAAAPHEVLGKLNDQFVINAVLADPVGARETWGQLPEHQIKTPAETKFRDAEQ